MMVELSFMVLVLYSSTNEGQQNCYTISLFPLNFRVQSRFFRFHFTVSSFGEIKTVFRSYYLPDQTIGINIQHSLILPQFTELAESPIIIIDI